jgi:hypothetical protein
MKVELNDFEMNDVIAALMLTGLQYAKMAWEANNAGDREMFEREVQNYNKLEYRLRADQALEQQAANYLHNQKIDNIYNPRKDY